MTKEIEISPCPVCGGEMSLEKSPYGDIIMHGFRCRACRYESPTYFAESLAVEAHNEQAALILSRVTPAPKPATTPKRTRNEAARCGNCPYFARHPYSYDLTVCGIDSKTMHYGLKINLWKARTVKLLAAVLPLAEYIQETFGDMAEADPRYHETKIMLPLGRIVPMFDACTKVANAMGDEANADKG